MSFKTPSDFGGLFVSRVLVTGANGAGKTWLAGRLGLPVVHNDAFALKTGWAHEPTEVVLDRRNAAAAADRWVIEGGPSILSGVALARAELIVWLDIPPGQRLRRILWRSLRGMGQVRPEHPAGNRDWPGPRQIRFAVNAWRNADWFREAVLTRSVQADCPKIRLASDQEVTAFLGKWQA